MNRREMLRLTLAAAGTAYVGGLIMPNTGIASTLNFRGNSDRPLYCGWAADPKAKAEFIRKNPKPFFSDHNSDIKGSGKGKVVLLHKFFEHVTGKPLEPHFQEIGDCVSHTYGLGVDMLTAIRMTWLNKQERWLTKCATEIIYAGSRFEVGGGGIRGDGSMGVWAADFIRDWGVVLRKAYLDGKHDFTNYSGTLARELGRIGVPDELEPICKLHPVRTCSLVNSWEECRDSVANGHPVAMCSDVGFKDVRDDEGFLDRSIMPWYHAMLIIAIDDRYKRPGALVQNSWGKNWVNGPTRHGQPKGSFWVDAEIIDNAMRQGDSVALSGYVGYPKLKTPDYNIF